jgi:DNA-binding LacI/PurR family transcriptional regulator
LESTLLVHALWQYGVAIPGEVSLVGFNDVSATRYMTPPLTTVGFDAAKIGELGTRLVLEQVGASESERQPTVLTVKPTLIVRGSTGPLAKRNALAHFSEVEEPDQIVGNQKPLVGRS